MSEIHPTRYPLAWPDGWRRTPGAQRRHATFGVRERQNHSYMVKKDLTVAMAVRRVLETLERMDVSEADVVISTNVELRLDGLPRSDRRPPDDPGAAVYWRDHGANQVMAVDSYSTVYDNLAAIAATLEAMRAIERHGGAEILDRAFTGFAALPPARPMPASMTRDEAERLLGLGFSETGERVIREAWRTRTKDCHPDLGGDPEQFLRLTEARDLLLRAAGTAP